MFIILLTFLNLDAKTLEVNHEELDDDLEEHYEDRTQNNFSSNNGKKDPYDQLRRVNEEEWKNIPKVVKQTFRLLIDFAVAQK